VKPQLDRNRHFLINQYEVSSHDSEEPIEGANGSVVSLKVPTHQVAAEKSITELSNKTMSKKRLNVEFANLPN
jgi:hypothetical protein